MSKSNAIQTHYAGCHFRSRLEARWAVFLDAAGVKWEYEKEGYDLRNYEDENFQPLGYYLPDFWLPEYETWLEIKGGLPATHWKITHAESQIYALVDITRSKAGFVFFGLPDLDTPSSCVMYNDVFPNAPPLSPDRNYGTVVDMINRHPLTDEIIATAKSARFEFGAKGC